LDYVYVDSDRPPPRRVLRFAWQLHTTHRSRCRTATPLLRHSLHYKGGHGHRQPPALARLHHHNGRSNDVTIYRPHTFRSLCTVKTDGHPSHSLRGPSQSGSYYLQRPRQKPPHHAAGRHVPPLQKSANRIGAASLNCRRRMAKAPAMLHEDSSDTYIILVPRAQDSTLAASRVQTPPASPWTLPIAASFFRCDEQVMAVVNADQPERSSPPKRGPLPSAKALTLPASIRHRLRVSPSCAAMAYLTAHPRRCRRTNSNRCRNVPTNEAHPSDGARPQDPPHNNTLCRQSIDGLFDSRRLCPVNAGGMNIQGTVPSVHHRTVVVFQVTPARGCP